MYLLPHLAQLVEALCYKPEGRGFDAPWGHQDFSFTKSFRPHYGFGVDSASNKNDYLGYLLRARGGRCLGLTTLPLSCTEIWKS